MILLTQNSSLYNTINKNQPLRFWGGFFLYLCFLAPFGRRRLLGAEQGGAPEPSAARRGGGSTANSRQEGANRRAHPSRAERGEEEGYPFLNSLTVSAHSRVSDFIALMMYPFVLVLFLTALLAMV